MDMRRTYSIGESRIGVASSFFTTILSSGEADAADGKGAPEPLEGEAPSRRCAGAAAGRMGEPTMASRSTLSALSSARPSASSAMDGRRRAPGAGGPAPAAVASWRSAAARAALLSVSMRSFVSSLEAKMLTEL